MVTIRKRRIRPALRPAWPGPARPGADCAGSVPAASRAPTACF